ncbi:hypothetical protein Tco_1346425 [Tanacetum coccineum]
MAYGVRCMAVSIRPPKWWASIASRLPGRTGEIKKLLELSFKEALQPNSASEPTDTKPKTLPTTHIAEWQNVRVEADARMSITLILLSLSTGAGDFQRGNKSQWKKKGHLERLAGVNGPAGLNKPAG